jgi:hypothetical protein
MNQTKTAPIPIPRIQALRLTCNHCRSALIIPLDAREVPGQCFNCCQPFPSAGIQALLREMYYIRRELAEDKTRRYDIAIEALIDD